MDKSQEKKIITRIAPSPTGNLHIGTARSALFNFLFARQNKGKFILRIEDTDKERNKKEFEDDILNGLEWLGLKSDEVYRQSERTDIYKKYIEQMLSAKTAYISKEESKTEKGKEVEVVRLKNQNKKVEFKDIIRGKIEFDTTELGDFVIARNIDEPLYHLAVVIDDYEMAITHIIRGEDHISNTPRQILIQEALGIERPLYAHIPLILAQDRSKMSKRGNNTTSISEYRKNSYISTALVNYMALLGWNPGTDRELFALNELIKEFDLKKIQKGGAVFNIEKLNWFNGEYIKKMPEDKLLLEIEKALPKKYKKIISDDMSSEKIKKIIPIVIERINVFSDISKMADSGELDYFFIQPKYEASDLLWKTDKDVNIPKKHLEKIIELIKEISENDFSKESVKKAVWEYAEKEGKGSVLWPLRYAFSGREKSPDPFELAEVLGKKEVIDRLNYAVKKYN